MSGNTTQLTTTGGNYWTNHTEGHDRLGCKEDDDGEPCSMMMIVHQGVHSEIVHTTQPSGGNSNKDPHAWVILDGKDLELSSFNVLKSINKARGAEKKATIAKGQYHIKWEMSATIINFLRTRGITITANTQIIISGRNGKAADAREIFRFQLHLS
ncbi:uncharacterized protein LACBIDRAFT_306422 [Laccaria bicolor S238N-H82]|uniref:Predicted protein n=1 Tax=Laccaria bicolor (strain S238N-H82 / ATCC MYA-4686) TaxID=486041 RepID=B0DMV9_LACBS|nr:uncharacterized protein LACBIDRAFT_306422 [Laccaria bicolor S238N-H82]EDR04119.1 predicted protein [Laccaria bicolor S238N-H82]|eukprot:XP_001885374.1 predicted protein [Laccaria bicolor S238N-H82]